MQGTLTFVRIYSGVLEAGTYVANPNKGKKERIGRIQLMHANNREDIKVRLHAICHACCALCVLCVTPCDGDVDCCPALAAV